MCTFYLWPTSIRIFQPFSTPFALVAVIKPRKPGVQDPIRSQSESGLRKKSTPNPPIPNPQRQIDPLAHRHVEPRRRRRRGCGEPGAGAGRRRGGRRGPGDGAVRGGVLLERGADVPAAPGCGAHGGGLLAGPPPRPDLPRRLRRRHRPRRGGPRPLRPRGVPLRRPPRRLLGQAQPHHAQQTGQRRRDAVPVGHLLLHGGAGEGGEGVAGGEAEGVEAEDRDGDPPGEEVLRRRGVPPALPREGRPVRQEELQRPNPLLRLMCPICRHCTAHVCTLITRHTQSCL